MYNADFDASMFCDVSMVCQPSRPGRVCKLQPIRNTNHLYPFFPCKSIVSRNPSICFFNKKKERKNQSSCNHMRAQATSSGALMVDRGQRNKND